AGPSERKASLVAFPRLHHDDDGGEADGRPDGSALPPRGLVVGPFDGSFRPGPAFGSKIPAPTLDLQLVSGERHEAPMRLSPRTVADDESLSRRNPCLQRAERPCRKAPGLFLGCGCRRKCKHKHENGRCANTSLHSAPRWDGDLCGVQFAYRDRGTQVPSTASGAREVSTRRALRLVRTTERRSLQIAPDPLPVVAVARSELLSEILLFRQDGDEVHDEKRHGRED